MLPILVSIRGLKQNQIGAMHLVRLLLFLAWIHSLQGRFRYDLRKYYFTNRITSIWNSISDHVVSSSNINIFKNRLDKFMLGQDLIYNWKSDYSGAGSRSSRDDTSDFLE